MNAITEARTIEQVVEAINSESSVPYFGGYDTRDAEEMAGQYAWNAADESGFTDADSIRFHLEYLQEHGAVFHHETAFQHAIDWSFEDA